MAKKGISYFLNSTKQGADFLKNTQQSQCPIGPQNGCGSCPLSFLPYSTQLQVKKAYLDFKLNQTIERLFKENVPEYAQSFKKQINKTPILPSAKQSHYRNKMEYTVGYKGDFGLREKGKWWRVLDKHTCFLASPSIEKLFFAIHPQIKNLKVSFYDRKAHTGALRLISIRQNKKNHLQIGFVLSNPDNPLYQLKHTKEFYKKVFTDLLDTLSKDFPYLKSGYLVFSDSIADVFSGQLEHFWGDSYITETISFNDIKTEFILDVATFFQTNLYTYTNYLQILYGFLKKINKTDVLFDLYGGIGFLSLPFRNFFKNIVIVEKGNWAQELGNLILEQNSITNARFMVNDIDNLIQDINIQNQTVILDPSRAGLSKKTLTTLVNNPPSTLLYVSCNPIRFFEEYLTYFANIYKISASVLLDNFPNTEHQEGFFLLTKQ